MLVKLKIIVWWQLLMTMDSSHCTQHFKIMSDLDQSSSWWKGIRQRWELENNFAFPLHIACQYRDSASVVQYLLELDTRTLRFVDIDNNTALHYACRGAKHDTIVLLSHAVSVSKRNAYGKLPIELLWESNAVGDRESLEYMESVSRLLRADPEIIHQ